MYIETHKKSSTFVQFVASIPLAALVTLSLLLLMHQLIFSDMSPPIEDAPVIMPKITLERTTVKAQNTEAVKKPEPVEEIPEVEPAKVKKMDGIQMTIPEIEVAITAHKGGINLAAGRYPVAHLLSSPRYPRRALLREIEGWVDVIYDISAHGITENIRVIKALPEGYFEKAALDAVKRWRYQPLLDDNGQPSPFKGLSKRVVFEMEK